MAARSPIRFTPPSGRQLLAHVLDERELVAAIQELEPRALARLIDHVGLEDAGELIALATTDQLARVFDEDLWRRGRPGEDETFDAARFVVWLEVMLEAGAAFTADRLAELPEDLVVHAFHQQMLVIDLDALGVEVSGLGEDGDELEKALDGCLYHELDVYRLIARRHDGWDAIVTVLVALDEDHHDLLIRVLERCCALSSRAIDDGGGLYDVLTSEEMLAGDVAAEREDRRAGEGYIAPSQAAAFLRLAAATDLATARTQDRDPITRAYFRELAPRPAAGAAPPPPTAPPATARRAPGKTAALAVSAPGAAGRRLTELLRASGVLDDGAPPARRLGAGAPAAATAASDASFRAALIALRARDPAGHGQRMAGLGYLANVLVAAGDGGDGRSFRPAEAAAGAVTACGLGLAHLCKVTGRPADVLVGQVSADGLFRLGWRLLHERTGAPGRALIRPSAGAR